jgi:hypothetical protein
MSLSVNIFKLDMQDTLLKIKALTIPKCQPKWVDGMATIPTISNVTIIL